MEQALLKEIQLSHKKEPSYNSTSTNLSCMNSYDTYILKICASKRPPVFSIVFDPDSIHIDQIYDPYCF